MRFVAVLLVACSGGGSFDASVDGDAARDGAGDAEDAADAVDAHAELWRSALYPELWEPGYHDTDGRFLHDFSYAGYRGGEVPTTRGAVFEVDADPSGGEDATDAIQLAIDAASVEGGVVHVPDGLFRVEGVLSIGSSNVVIRGEGSTRSRIYFTKSEGMSSRSHITVGGAITHDLTLPLGMDAATGATSVRVGNPGDLAVGDDIAIGWTITDAFVEAHGMEGTWQAFNGMWQPFFRRTVVGVERDAEGAWVTVDVPLRYDTLMRDGSELRRERGIVREVGVESIGLSNVVSADEAWAERQVHVLELRFVADAWVRDVASFASPLSPRAGEGAGAHLASGGIIVRGSKRVTVTDTTMSRAVHRGGGGNGYLFELRTSSEVLFSDCVGSEGRHNFIQNWGFGVSGCVWLRVRSRGGVALASRGGFRLIGLSEFHHSLATANLIDSSVLDDGWLAANRLHQSSGAGHCATQNVFWNTRGEGVVRSSQWGWGYVIGTGPDLRVESLPWEEVGTEPADWNEGLGYAEGLRPGSLYEDQRARRLGR